MGAFARQLPVIQILPLGPMACADLLAVADTIRSLFRCGCELLTTSPLPTHAYRLARGQYDADLLLEYLFDRLPSTVLRLVALTESDLFAEGRNFVFGYAHMRDRVAVFSTLRLRERYWGRSDDPVLFRSRVDKAIAHELGHTFHAPHCEEPSCVMHQVEFLWQLDQLNPGYCASCVGKVHGTAARGVDGAEALVELAGSYMRRRRFVRAAAVYAAAVKRDPTNPQVHNDHGVALLATGDRAAAAHAFERAIRIAPEAPHAYYNLGILSRERGDVTTADFFFNEALVRDGDARAAARYLGILHQDYFHDSSRARRYFEHYLSLGGSDTEVIGRLESLGGRPDRRGEHPGATRASAVTSSPPPV